MSHREYKESEANHELLEGSLQLTNTAIDFLTIRVHRRHLVNELSNSTLAFVVKRFELALNGIQFPMRAISDESTTRKTTNNM